MKKKKIAIASVLKPADDVRAFEKMAMTLVKAGYEVYLIGMPATTRVSPPGIHFLELAPFHRLHFKRLLAPLVIGQKIRKVRPEVLIVNTHELLVVNFLNRILFGVATVYDVQENYYRNILWTSAFPGWMRRPIAWAVRLKERVFAPWVNRVIFAEKCYASELKFMSGKAVVVENKSLLPPDFRRVPKAGKTVLAFTGTLGESTGVFDAIRLTDLLHEKDPSVELEIIGFCPRPNVLKRLQKMCGERPYISMEAGPMQVGHERIVDLLQRAHFGIISYPPSPHTSGRIPTKLFEYVSARLPILICNHGPWVELTARVSAAIPLDFENLDGASILDKMKHTQFYTSEVDWAFWRNDEQKLLDLVASL